MRRATIAVMAYRDTADGPNGIITRAGCEVAAGSLAGKSVTIGDETAANTFDHVTFYEEGNAEMEAALADVALEWSTTSGYRGNAIHPLRELSGVGALRASQKPQPGVTWS